MRAGDAAAYPARRTGPRWSMVAAGAALIACCYGFARFAYGLFAPQLREEFALTATLSGVISAGSYVGYCVAIVVSLVLTERLGPRRVAIAAGATAALGTAIVALAPTATVLAAGILVAGSSTGLASPPLAAAVGRWVWEEGRDRAQTIANSGTGLGVIASGPVALAATDSWRAAWAGFAVVSVAVTLWVARVVPATPPGDRAGRAVGATRWVPGGGRLVAAAFLLGFASIAMWTFGQDLVAAEGDFGRMFPGVAWIVLGAAGTAGGFAGDVVRRLGLSRAWTATMLLLAAATLLLPALPDRAPTVLLAVAVFGAAYIALTGIVLIWGTRLFPDNASYGVALGFLVIAVGQAVGAPVVGALGDLSGLPAAFVGCAAVGVAAALVRPAIAPTR